jgi:exodeoxyribonuclease V alpha subunit
MCCDLTMRIVGVTGGAGTGKTLVLGRAYKELGSFIGVGNIALAAPTGRAAKRIQELTRIGATTVHRLLKFPMPDDPITDEEILPNEPRHNRNNPLSFKVVFVDEASMIAPTLYMQLLDAMPSGGVVRFFGDNNQLPPVEAGAPPFISVLEKFPSVTLTFNYRSDDAIVGNAMRILRGSIPVANDRFHILYSENPVKTLIEYVDKEFVEGNNQIILPTRKGKYGTLRVNPSIQLKFNGKQKRMLTLSRYDDKEEDLCIREGDKFLWIKNDYKLDMSNGEIGRVAEVDAEVGSLLLATPERDVLVPPYVRSYNPIAGHMMTYDPRKQIELGYAVTTHKSQGSEFDKVIYCMCSGQAYLIGRRNFYTGITRAKHEVIIITDRKAMGMSIRPNRHTG